KARGGRDNWHLTNAQPHERACPSDPFRRHMFLAIWLRGEAPGTYDSLRTDKLQCRMSPCSSANDRPRAGPHTSGELLFDHVKFGVSDYAASKAFFLNALEPLGVAVVSEGLPTYGVELSPKGKASLCLYQTEEKPAHLHLAFTAENRQQVEAFYRAALEAGGKDNGAPGLCPDYHANYYAAFVIGP